MFIFILFHFVQGATFIQILNAGMQLPCEFWCWLINGLENFSFHCFFFPPIIFSCFAPEELSSFLWKYLRSLSLLLYRNKRIFQTSMQNKRCLAKKDERKKKERDHEKFLFLVLCFTKYFTSCVIDCFPCSPINQSYHMELFISKP